MTAEQHTFEQHFITHTKPNKMEDLLLDCQRKWIPSNLYLLTSLQSEEYMLWNAGWTEKSRFSAITS
jgi:hypothetical protein